MSPVPVYKYKAGQIVYCRFPYLNDPGDKDRPGLILSSYHINGECFYRIAKLTKTNQTGKYHGKFVLKDSKEGKAMRLEYDSFFHLERIVSLPEVGIRRLMSICSIFSEIKNLCKEKGINP